MKSINDILEASLLDNAISEASLLDIEGTLDFGDVTIEFANWVLKAAIEVFEISNQKCPIDISEDSIMKLIKCISSPAKGVFIIDVEKMFENKFGFMCDRMFFTENSIKNMPKGLKTIKIYGLKYGDYQLSCYTNDISKINIEIYSDSGRSYGNIDIRFWSKLKNKDVKLGNITCNTFKLGTYASKIESILFGKDSIMLNIDLSENDHLMDVYGRFSDATIVKFPKQLVAKQLASTGFIPHGCELRIYG